MIRKCLLLSLFISTILSAAQASEPAPPAVDVQVVTDEADAVLAILAKRKAGEAVAEADWRRLFSSEGYVRLKKRDTGMGRPFEDSDFRGFVLSEELAARAGSLAETFAKWTKTDASGAARRALAYLPDGARIRAKIYPVIKPRDNSFVFEVKTDPAIFLYLDPAVTAEQFENTLTHELHHIGNGGSCPPAAVEAEISRLPKGVRTVLLWMGAFGEGLAMLAAAGGPDVHPHAVSKAADRERWDRDVARFPEDLRKIETFFQDVLAGRLDEEGARKTAASFYGETQGPWYTVGWKMATTIEKAFGRQRLVESFCDPRKLLAAYNDAARKDGTLPLWSEEVVKALAAGSPRIGSFLGAPAKVPRDTQVDRIARGAVRGDPGGLGSHPPRLRARPPSLGTRSPTLGNQPPTLGTRSPRLGARPPGLGDHSPRFRGRPPRLGTRSPTLGNQPPT